MSENNKAPFLSKQKEYVSDYNKNRYIRQKNLINNLENVKGVQITDYCQFCHYHTDNPWNMKMHLTSSKHNKNMQLTLMGLKNKGLKVKDGTYISFM